MKWPCVVKAECGCIEHCTDTKYRVCNLSCHVANLNYVMQHKLFLAVCLFFKLVVLFYWLKPACILFELRKIFLILYVQIRNICFKFCNKQAQPTSKTNIWALFINTPNCQLNTCNCNSLFETAYKIHQAVFIG